ncbi:PREDICTED: uncharacterized protein LOC108545736 [Eufriesea mexicana]|uniref:uncharacterized protein LOC108545736 n=1 Tax=Eufriesea mexicana TaxID=516756 RepID=UPI00083C304E|nr:PREDICTED: uncharacterized protein LOC108545736 [Eufriesea mexicana]
MLKGTTKIEKFGNQKAWRPLSAKDFDSLMRPCFFITAILGYFPYKRTPYTYVFSRIRFAFNTLLMIIYVFLLLVVIYEINFLDAVTYSVPETIHENLYIFLEGIVILVMYALTGSRLSVLQNISQISSMLPAKEFDSLAKVIHTKDIVYFLILLSHLPNCLKHNIFLTVKNFTNLYITAVNFVIDMFYFNCVYILSVCFKKLDQGIWELKRVQFDDGLVPRTFIILDQNNVMLLLKMKDLEEKHMQISDAVQSVNNTFMIRIIILSLMTFIEMSFNIYFKIIHSYDIVLTNNKFWYSQDLGPASLSFFKFSLIIWACEKAVNQANKIKMTLYEVFSDTTDPMIKHEVQLFSLQILQRNNIFTTKAFDMNSSFLMKIIGGILMYIVILIQFLYTYASCKS